MVYLHTLQQGALTLGAYNYTIQYKIGPDHTNADMLSRLPMPPGENLLAIAMLETLPVTAKEVESWITKDPITS